MRPYALAFLLVATTAAAQTDRAARFMDNCRNRWNDDDRFCETRSYTLAAGRTLSVDGSSNGGIAIHGWDKNEVQVLAMVQANGDNVADAQALAKQVSVIASGGDVRAEGPSRFGRHQSWSVSYDIYVPRQTELTLSANNGGISVESMVSKIQAETENGGLSFSDVAGDVHGRTVNGGITAQLTGDRWIGAGLDLRTSNGGVHLTIPQNYSANLETGTVNGSLNVDFPITISGRIGGRQFATTLGAGGATIRATTTNGGVSIKRR